MNLYRIQLAVCAPCSARELQSTILSGLPADGVLECYLGVVSVTCEVCDELKTKVGAMNSYKRFFYQMTVSNIWYHIRNDLPIQVSIMRACVMLRIRNLITRIHSVASDTPGIGVCTNVDEPRNQCAIARGNGTKCGLPLW